MRQPRMCRPSQRRAFVTAWQALFAPGPTDTKTGYVAEGSSPEELAKLIAKWSVIIKSVGIKVY
jgi:hypothetical protein